ncbi:hypothetical protein CIK04_31380, partial [Vibrio sp. 03_296]|uniref:hypothetical protein n=1 Tax=Vibrio sp. 03_296 TaxID=2024409 RepID=UPI000BCBDD4B
SEKTAQFATLLYALLYPEVKLHEFEGEMSSSSKFGVSQHRIQQRHPVDAFQTADKGLAFELDL